MDDERKGRRSSASVGVAEIRVANGEAVSNWSLRHGSMSDMEELIRKLAYELWEQAGRPDGRGDEFWFAARYEFERREETGETRLGAPAPLRTEPSRRESAADCGIAA